MLALGVVLSLAAVPATRDLTVEAEVRLYWSKDEKNPARRATSRSEAVDRGLKQAREQALARALKDAVASFSSGPVGESLMADERLYGNVAALVTEGELKEEHTDDWLKISMTATVQTGAIENELAEIKRKMTLLGQKRVLLAVGELTYDANGELTQEGSRRAMSSALAEMLKRDGWVIYDGAGRFENGNPTREEVDRVGREMGVDQVLTGAVTIHRLKGSRSSIIPELNERGEQINFFVTGEYNLELVDPGTWVRRALVSGKLEQRKMSRVQSSQSYAATEVAFVQATTPVVAGELREKMLAMLADLAANGMEISVVMTQVDLAQVAAFEKVLAKLPNVKQVTARGDYADRTQAVEVRFSGTANDLATAIAKAKGHKFAVTSVKKARIELAPK